MKNALIIVNKKSGTGDKKHITELVSQRINKAALRYEIAFTAYKGHATELSHSAVRQGVDLVVAAGGDGSVNEVASALVHTGTPMGILPMGSGNGLARSLHIPLAPFKALDVINNFHVRTIDVGFANKHLFLSNAGVGFDALVAKNFEQSRRRGLMSYIFTIMRSLAAYKPASYELTVDGIKQKHSAFFIGIANGNQLGYNFKIAPEATPDDGLLDVCVIGPIPIWRLPLAAYRAYRGSLPQSAFVEYVRCSSLLIQGEKPMGWMQADGDAFPVEGNTLEVSVLPQALQVVTP